MIPPISSAEKTVASGSANPPTADSATLAQVVLSSVPPLAEGRKLAPLHPTPSSANVLAVTEKHAPFPTSPKDDNAGLSKTREKRPQGLMLSTDQANTPSIKMIQVFDPTSTNQDLKDWVATQLSLPVEGRTTNISLQHCRQITDPTILEPMAESLEKLDLGSSGITKICPSSPLWLADLGEADLNNLVALRKVLWTDDLEVINESYDEEAVESVRIKFPDFETALAYLSGHIQPDKRSVRNAFVMGYDLPNGKTLVPQGCCFAKGSFYNGSRKQRLELLNRAVQEFANFKSESEGKKGN